MINSWDECLDVLCKFCGSETMSLWSTETAVQARVMLQRLATQATVIFPKINYNYVCDIIL